MSRETLPGPGKLESLEAGSQATGTNPDPSMQKGQWGDAEPCDPDRKPSCKNQDRGEKLGSERDEVDPFKEVKRCSCKKKSFCSQIKLGNFKLNKSTVCRFKIGLTALK